MNKHQQIQLHELKMYKKMWRWLKEYYGFGVGDSQGKELIEIMEEIEKELENE